MDSIFQLFIIFINPKNVYNQVSTLSGEDFENDYPSLVSVINNIAKDAMYKYMNTLVFCNSKLRNWLCTNLKLFLARQNENTKSKHAYQQMKKKVIRNTLSLPPLPLLYLFV